MVDSAFCLSARDHSQVRVVKVGGSLLRRCDLKFRVQSWLSAQTPIDTVLIVGGGSEVDSLRKSDQQSDADQESVHWAAIDVMSRNALRFHASLDQSWTLVADLGELRESLASSPRCETIIFDCGNWLRSESTLPHNWDVTSDSIALALGGCLGAQEVVLLKSISTQPDMPVADLARAGVIDAYAETALANAKMAASKYGIGLNLSLVNLSVEI